MARFGQLARYTAVIGSCLCMLFALQGQEAKAQPWVEKWTNPNTPLDSVRASFDQYWAGKPYERSRGIKPFERSYYRLRNQISTSQDRNLPAKYQKIFLDSLRLAARMASVNPQPLPLTANGAWQPLGPFYTPQGGGTGRLNRVIIHPGTTNRWWVCAPNGGLWEKKPNQPWTTNTDTLASIGMSDLAINPLNPNTMYLATGDADAWDAPSIGLLKSTNGGLTWNPTGLSNARNDWERIYRLLLHPTDTNLVILSGTDGVWRSTDGGATFTKRTTAEPRDMEWRPWGTPGNTGGPAVMYGGTGSYFYRSVDTGATWTAIFPNSSNGLPSAGDIGRIAIATTKNDPARVYLLISNDTDNGYLGTYMSTDNGLTFSLQSSTPNILDWSHDGSGSGGQSWYDLAIAASPTDADHIMIGGVNVWESSDAGATWNQVGHWYGANGHPYVHADIHDIVARTDQEWYVANDGGLFQTTNSGTSWTDVGSGLNINQFYRMDVAENDTTIVVGGFQDNGSNIKRGPNWREMAGGDGMHNHIDPENARYIYASYQNGGLIRSTDTGGSFTNARSGIWESGNWVTPWQVDPTNSAVVWAGFRNLWRSPDRGASWVRMDTLPYSNNLLDRVRVANDGAHIYMSRASSLFHSADTGQTWQNVTSGLPNLGINDVIVSANNPLHIYVALSGYNGGQKVFRSTNGGLNWSNISQGIPNISVNCLVHVTGSTPNNSTAVGELYLGTDVGVYHRDTGAVAQWTRFSDNLPITTVNELKVHYASARLYAATYGRGLWISELHSNLTAVPPIALFGTPTTTVCGSTGASVVQYLDSSRNTPTSWSWEFPGGTPATSTLQNPSVTYAQPGNYTVRLRATNAAGYDISTRENIFQIVQPLATPYTQTFEAQQGMPQGWRSVDSSATGASWEIFQNGTGTIGIPLPSQRTVRFSNYYLNTLGARTLLVSPPISLVGLQAPAIRFARAYAAYSLTEADTLHILASNDCGATWQTLAIYDGSALPTIAPTNAFYVPAANDWVYSTVNFPPSFIGASEILIAFEDRSDYGNNLYLDDIRIANTTNVTAAFTSPDTVCAFEPFTVTDNSSGPVQSRVWTATGAFIGVPTTSMYFTQTGTISLRLVATNPNGNDTLTRVIEVLPAPSNAIVQFANNLNVESGHISYAWFADAAPVSGQGSILAITAPGNYTCVITGANGCQTICGPFFAQPQGFENFTNNANNAAGIRLYPNPATQRVTLELSSVSTSDAQGRITDAQGRTVKMFNVVKGTEKTELTLTGIAPGLYFLELGAVTIPLQIQGE